MRKIEAGLLIFIFLCVGMALYLAIDIFIDSDAEVFEDALSIGDVSSCSGIKDIALRNSCVSSIAINQAIISDDVGVCHISSNFIGCEYAYYVSKAKTTGDLSFCSFTDSNRCRDEYYLNKAVISKDKFMCSMISDSNLKKICEAI
jgi:hypothetical protein